MAGGAAPGIRACARREGRGTALSPRAWAVLGLATIASGGVYALWTRPPAEVPVPGVYQGPAYPAAPVLPETSLGRPSFESRGATATRGTGFVVEHKGKRYLFSAYHIFGSALGQSVQTVTLRRGDRTLCFGAGPLPVEGAKMTAGIDDARTDFAVIPIASSYMDAHPLRLAAKPPQVGQPVWLLHLPVADGAEGVFQKPEANQLAKGRVTRSSNRVLQVAYDGGFDFRWTSGAPVLDADGAVVGINTWGAGDATHVVAAAVPHGSLLGRLQAP